MRCWGTTLYLTSVCHLKGMWRALKLHLKLILVLSILLSHFFLLKHPTPALLVPVLPFLKADRTTDHMVNKNSICKSCTSTSSPWALSCKHQILQLLLLHLCSDLFSLLRFYQIQVLSLTWLITVTHPTLTSIYSTHKNSLCKTQNLCLKLFNITTT